MFQAVTASVRAVSLVAFDNCFVQLFCKDQTNYVVAADAILLTEMNRITKELPFIHCAPD